MPGRSTTDWREALLFTSSVSTTLGTYEPGPDLRGSGKGLFIPASPYKHEVLSLIFPSSPVLQDWARAEARKNDTVLSGAPLDRKGPHSFSVC